ncbi:M48 family metalloprotease [Phormidium yuhuli AB48]|uniref:M48 family metalloprotease n=1 Tax=Phormidium yuhuli AB48 TaxID=2940671 RepID=A0ABY5APV5_9CYAN|nr:M48 family metalloprotease [Phormidium yuhuli]USR91025.1 M48 family metalloprotease [Phormidium yuhuli AB48]
MKSLRTLLCFLLGTSLFLSLNLFLPSLPLLRQRAVAAQPLNDLVVHKSISFKTHPEMSATGEKSLNALSSGGDRQLAQRPILQEQGRLTNRSPRLRDGSRYNIYDFSGNAGQEVRIRLESSEFDTYLILIGPNNQPLAETDDRSPGETNSELVLNLPENGTYRIVANALDSRGRGNYQLAVYPAGPTYTAQQQKPDPNAPQNVSAPASLSEREALLAQGDRYHLQGNFREAERLYRQAKPEFPAEGTVQIAEAITEDQLSPAGRVYWNNVQEGLAEDRESQVEASLDLLFEEAPGFAPPYTLIAQRYLDEGDTDEAIAFLEEATTRFPGSYELARMLAETLRADGQRLEASIAAREFAIVNPDHPQAGEMTELADRYLGQFRGRLRENIALRGLGGLAVGVLTGRTTSTVFQAINLAQLMIAGESRLGDQISQQLQGQLRMVNDPEILGYVDELGQDVARYMGRDEFDYEFFVVDDDNLNAFALPGGKVFVNTGAILAANSEAELAGLLGHEVGHAVLSHGFQRVVTNNLLANLAREIPFGNLLGTLVSLDYSRKHERQSDIIGTRVIHSAGYAADGLRNFMQTLRERHGGGPAIPYLSTHPAPRTRVRYMEELIERNNYNRYSFEGVERHAQIKARLS